jgi:hypothetical protein
MKIGDKVVIHNCPQHNGLIGELRQINSFAELPKSFSYSVKLNEKHVPKVEDAYSLWCFTTLVEPIPVIKTKVYITKRPGLLWKLKAATRVLLGEVGIYHRK